MVVTGNFVLLQKVLWRGSGFHFGEGKAAVLERLEPGRYILGVLSIISELYIVNEFVKELPFAST